MTTLVFYFVFFLFSNVQVLNADCDVASETTASGTFYEPKERLCPGDLIFEDNFDTFNLKRWQHEITLAGGGNWEFQYYSNNRTNSYADNGLLHIKPTYLSDDVGEDYLYSGTFECYGGGPADQCTNPSSYGCSRTGSPSNILNPIKSARIRTVDSFSFKYGSVVIRAKLPAGDWLWPAIWLLPRDNSYGTWPASGEIDLLESRGNKKLVTSQGVNVGTQQVSQTLHWGPFSTVNQWPKTHWEKNNIKGYDSDFHIYKLVWNSAGITFYIDNEAVGSVVVPEDGFWGLGGFEGIDNPWKGASKMAPFDQEFYLLINLAVGGVNFFSDDFTNPGGKPWSNTSPTAATDFWRGRSQWDPTWNLGTEDSHLIVDSVQVIALSEEHIPKAIQSNGAFVIKAGEMQQIINHSVINYKAFFRWLYASIMHLMDEPIPSDIQKMTQQDLACITEFLQNFDNYGQEKKDTKFIMERLGQYLVDANLTIKPDMTGNDWTQFLEDNECLKNNPNILTHYINKSLIQVFNELKSNVDKVFESPLESIEKQVAPINRFNCFNFGTSGVVISSINITSDMLLFSFLKSSKSVYLIQVHIDESGKCQSRCGKVFFSQNLGNESEHTEELFDVIDTKFYSTNILSVLLQESANSRRGVLLQFSLSPSLEQLKEFDVSTGFKEETIPNINGSCSGQKIYKNVEMSVSQFSVSGSRRVSIVLAENKRKVKLFEMECEEDEEEDAEMTSLIKEDVSLQSSFSTVPGE